MRRREEEKEEEEELSKDLGMAENPMQDRCRQPIHHFYCISSLKRISTCPCIGDGG